ncbi:MAG TPA: stage II sporulation protein M [Acidimicrobiales bacterium]|nr:stage II sporulation protein M [Acidimicrobiales bacterium]
MDVDSYIRTNQPVWARLDELTTRAGRGVGRLSAAELEELVRLYLRVSTHLSYARTFYRDPALTASLTGRVARSGAVVYGTRSRTLRAVGRFFKATFPAALWHVRHFVAVSAVLLFVPALAFGIWIANSPRALEATGPEALRQSYVEEDFEDYYSSAPAAAFASQVFTNNVQVAVLAFAGGIAFCLLTALVLIFNGANLGVAAGLFHAVGAAPKFWGLILPHGLLELTAVCVAGAAGLCLGWTLIDPGDRPRAAALVEEGRRAMVIVLGLVVVFGVAGAIEGFVTGSGLATPVRVGIGIVAEVAFLLYFLRLGPTAYATAGPDPLTGGRSPSP